jgi:hypothetical protein
MAQESVSQSITIVLKSYSPIVLTLPFRTSICLGLWINTWEVADSTRTKTEKHLFTNGSECKQYDFYRDGNFKLVARLKKKCIKVFGDYLKNDTFVE